MVELTKNWKSESTPPRVVVVGISEIQALMKRGWAVEVKNCAHVELPDHPVYLTNDVSRAPSQILFLRRNGMIDLSAQCRSDTLKSLRAYESDPMTQQFLTDLLDIRQTPGKNVAAQSSLTNG